jgi:hypothetical protein
LSSCNLQVTTSHATSLSIAGTSQRYTAAPGSTMNICIPTAGQVQLVTSSCFLFGNEKGTFTVDVDPEVPLQPLVLQAAGVKLAGEVVVSAGSDISVGAAESADSSTTNSFPQDVTITAAASGQSADSAQVVKAVASDPARPGVYSYSLTVDLGASVVLTASVGDSSSLLLYPRSLAFQHDAASKECPPAIAAFEAKPGRMLAGSVEPAVEGVVSCLNCVTSCCCVFNTANCLHTDSRAAYQQMVCALLLMSLELMLCLSAIMVFLADVLWAAVAACNNSWLPCRSKLQQVALYMSSLLKLEVGLQYELV